jgi:hypothetical protein
VIDRKKSHGEVIKLGDGSHLTSVEIEETEPFWASDLKDAAVHMAENLKSHVEVMRETKKAVTGLERVTRQIFVPTVSFDDASIVAVLEVSPACRGWCARCRCREILRFSAEGVDGWDRVCGECGRALLKRLEEKG